MVWRCVFVGTLVLALHASALSALAPDSAQRDSAVNAHYEWAARDANSTVSDVEDKFSVYLTSWSEGQPTDFLVFSNGSVTSAFETCTPNNESDPTLACFQVDAFEDRTLFSFDFKRSHPNGSAITLDEPLQQPVITSTEGRAHPKILDYRHELDASKGGFAISYMCSPPTDPDSRNEEVQMSLSWTMPNGDTIQAKWRKVCGGGRLEDIVFGYRDHRNAIVPFNGDGTHGADRDVGLEVSPHDKSTVFAIQLGGRVRSLDFMAPHVTSSKPEDAGFTVRGARTNTTLSVADGDTSEISVMYDCKTTVRADFQITIGIPPWNNLTASWTKDCGGNIPRSLIVGFGGPGAYDVMQDGEIETAYNLTESTTVDEARSTNKRMFEHQTHSAVFYLENIDETSDIHIQSVTVTLSPTDNLVVNVRSPSMKPLIGAGYVGRGGATLARQESRRLEIEFFCKKPGYTVVLVTLATVMFQNVEFGFVKECVAGHVHHRSALTAGSLLGAILFACVTTSALVACYVVRRRRRVAKDGGGRQQSLAKEPAKNKYTLLERDEENLEY